MITLLKKVYWKIRDKLFPKYRIIRLWIAKRIPLQNKVVFCNHFGKGFADDPKYIALAMLQKGTKAKLYWMTKDLNIELPEGITPVLYGSDDARWHLHTAKVWVYNYKNTFKVDKRKGQFYVQTWHGSFALKKVERDVEDLLSEHYLRDTKEDSAMIDLMYSNNEFKRNLFRNSFWYDGEVIKSDSPQLSILFNTPSSLRPQINYRYGISNDKKVVLYAPSFRNNVNLDVFKFDYKRILETVEEKFQNSFVILLRLHPNNACVSKEITEPDIINVTDYPDMDELMAVSDVMITDFSGVAFDMAIKRAPVFLFAKDYDSYINDERGLYMSISETPFTIAMDEESLCRNILEFEEYTYQKKIDTFFSLIGLEENGNGGQYIASIIMEKGGLR